MKKVLCRDCRNYLRENNDTWCRYDMWEGVSVFKSKIYNPFMFDCIEWERIPKERLAYRNIENGVLRSFKNG